MLWRRRESIRGPRNNLSLRTETQPWASTVSPCTHRQVNFRTRSPLRGFEANGGRALHNKVTLRSTTATPHHSRLATMRGWNCSPLARAIKLHARQCRNASQVVRRRMRQSWSRECWLELGCVVPATPTFIDSLNVPRSCPCRPAWGCTAKSGCSSTQAHPCQFCS